MFLARLAVIVALVLPGWNEGGDFDDEDSQDSALAIDLDDYDERIVDDLYEKELRAKKVEEDEETDEQAEAAYKAVEKKLKGMPKSEYNALVAKFDREEQAEELEMYLADEILLKEHGVNPDAASEVQSEQANKAAKERVAKMSPTQRDAEYKRLAAQEEKELAAEEAKDKAELAAKRARGEDTGERAARNAAVAVVSIVVFLAIFGGFKGVFWTILALGLAYRTASGSISES